MKNMLISLMLCVCVSCSSNKFIRKVKHPDNTQELIEFKAYLLEKNVINDFEASEPITGIEDPVILEFLEKYNIKLIHIWTCSKYNFNTPSSAFKTCGNTIEFYYEKIPMVSTVHSIIFDYSILPLELKDGINREKHKIADRIYVF